MKRIIFRLTLLLIVTLAAAWTLRTPLSRLFPIYHQGQLKRIAVFHKGGFSRGPEGTRQLNQFALIFEDNFNCEGYDSSFAAVKVGDHLKIKAFHDVKGWPLMDPEWWECDEAQLVEIFSDPAP